MIVNGIEKALVLLDLDGTLIRSFVTDGKASMSYSEVEVLPGRVEKLREIIESGAAIGLVTNQGGVAFGYQTEDQVKTRIGKAIAMLGLLAVSPWVYVCYSHKRAENEKYRVNLHRRKPEPGMLLEAMSDVFETGASTDAPPYIVIDQEFLDKTVYVGDMDTDALAAVGAGVDYVDAATFFGPPEMPYGQD